MRYTTVNLTGEMKQKSQKRKNRQRERERERERERGKHGRFSASNIGREEAIHTYTRAYRDGRGEPAPRGTKHASSLPSPAFPGIVRQREARSMFRPLPISCACFPFIYFPSATTSGRTRWEPRCTADIARLLLVRVARLSSSFASPARARQKDEAPRTPRLFLVPLTDTVLASRRNRSETEFSFSSPLQRQLPRAAERDGGRNRPGNQKLIRARCSASRNWRAF